MVTQDQINRELGRFLTKEESEARKRPISVETIGVGFWTPEQIEEDYQEQLKLREERTQAQIAFMAAEDAKRLSEGPTPEEVAANKELAMAYMAEMRERNKNEPRKGSVFIKSKTKTTYITDESRLLKELDNGSLVSMVLGAFNAFIPKAIFNEALKFGWRVEGACENPEWTPDWNVINEQRAKMKERNPNTAHLETIWTAEDDGYIYARGCRISCISGSSWLHD